MNSAATFSTKASKRVTAARVLTSIENLAILEEKERKKHAEEEEKKQRQREREEKRRKREEKQRKAEEVLERAKRSSERMIKRKRKTGPPSLKKSRTDSEARIPVHID